MKSITVLIKILKIPVLFIFFSYLVLWASYNLGGADYLFHIKAGEYITTQKVIPKEDIFSFTLEGKRWLDHEWLYQVLLYWLYKALGLDGLFLLRITLFSLAFFILALMVLKTDWVFGFPLLFYGLQISIRRFTLRPDNFSFLFLILFLAPFVFKKKRLLFLLPFVQILWVNIHGFFFLGPLVLALYLLLAKFQNTKGDRSFYNTAKIIFFVSIFACLLNPQPVATVRYPFMVVKDIFTGSQKVFYKYIQELKSPFSDIGKNSLFFAYIIFAVICLCFFKNTNWFYLALGGIMLIFSLNSMRNMYFFVPLAIAIFVNRYGVIKEIILESVLRQKGFLFLRIVFAVWAVIICIPLTQKIKDFPKLARAYISQDSTIDKTRILLSQEPSVYPQEMIDFMVKVKLPSRMFNTFNTGAMLIFNFFPQRQVFIDGRAEFYGQQFFTLYRDVVNADESKLKEILEKYQLQGFIISYFRDQPPPLIKLLVDKNFQCIYFGQKAMIFVSQNFLNNNPQLKQYQVDFKSLEVKKIDLLGVVKFDQPSMKGYYNLAYILYRLGYYQKSQEYLEQILRISPDHADSYYLLGLIYYQRGEYEKSFLYCRNSLLFKRSFPEARRLLARLYLKSGNIAGARQIAEKLNIDFNSLRKEVANE